MLLKKQQELVLETLGEPDGVLLIDEAGLVKRGNGSVDVSGQFCGSASKATNSQIRVYLRYACRKGHSYLVTS